MEVITTMKNTGGRNFIKWRSNRKNVDGVDVLEIPMVYSPKNILYAFQLKYRYAGIVKKELKKRKASIFHWHNIHFDPEIAKHITACNIGMIFTNHSSQFLEGLMNAKQLAYNKKNLSYADYIITPSTELKEETVKCGVDEKRVFFISNGVNAEKFSPNQGERIKFRKELGLTDEIAVICPRRVVPKCGVIYLAKALQHLVTKKSIKVFFTGLNGGDMTWRDISYESSVKLELNSSARNIVPVELNQIPNNEMISYYRAMDVCVLPSLIEATSIAGLEAMATGLTLIGTNVGGIPELIKDNENGLLVNKADEIGLATALDKLFENDELRKRLGSNARKAAVEMFNWPIIAKKVIDIYLKTQSQ